MACAFWHWPRAENVTVPESVRVYGYNGVSGDDFQVFYVAQHPDRVVPLIRGKLTPPEPSLTNRQSWEKYGITTAGELASCEDTREEILGYTCAMTRAH